MISLDYWCLCHPTCQPQILYLRWKPRSTLLSLPRLQSMTLSVCFSLSMISACGLRTWWPRSSWTSDMVAEGSQSTRPRETSRPAAFLTWFSLDVTQCNLCHTPFIVAITMAPPVQGEGPSLYFLIGRVSNNLQTYFKSTVEPIAFTSNLGYG